MLSLFELFSNLLEFLIGQLNWTITWLSPFKIRIQNQSDQPISPAASTAENSPENSNTTSETQPFSTSEIKLAGVGQLLQTQGDFIPAFMLAFDSPRWNEAVSNASNTARQTPHVDRDTASAATGESAHLDFVLAAGEPVEQSDLSSHLSSERSSYWYELIPDSQTDTLDALYPARNLLSQLYRSNDRSLAGQRELTGTNDWNLGMNDQDIPAGSGEWINVTEAIDYSDLTRSNVTDQTTGTITLYFTADETDRQAYSLDDRLEREQPTQSTATSTAQSIRYSPYYGYGLVDASAAVSTVLGQNDFPAVANLGGDSWGLDTVNAPEVWAQGYTGQGVVVAVVDSGVDYTHADLNANIWVNRDEIAGNGVDDDGNGYVDDRRGWDFVNSDSNPIDQEGHGTEVAGIIAAENNGSGITGVAYNATIMPVRVLDETGSGDFADVAAGVYYAVDNGADVINLSLGGGISSDLATAVEYAVEQGSLVVMAAGNEGSFQLTFPALLSTEYGVSVGAIDQDGLIADFSNRSTTPANYLLAPGVNVVSTAPDNSYTTFSGTSAATPYVSGVAALILSANSTLTASDLESLLTVTADSTGIA